MKVVGKYLDNFLCRFWGVGQIVLENGEINSEPPARFRAQEIHNL
jgi:hypothetical protein